MNNPNQPQRLVLPNHLAQEQEMRRNPLEVATDPDSGAVIVTHLPSGSQVAIGPRGEMSIRSGLGTSISLNPDGTATVRVKGLNLVTDEPGVRQVVLNEDGSRDEYRLTGELIKHHTAEELEEMKKRLSSAVAPPPSKEE